MIRFQRNLGKWMRTAAYSCVAFFMAVEACPPVDETVEARGLWVTRYEYATQAEVEDIIDTAAAAGFNQIYFQVRGTADALYASELEPWSARLTGVLGQDPGWDPLSVALERAHGYGLELHAYINIVPMWSGPTPPTESVPRHVYLEHPEWLMADASGTPMALNSSYVYMSPGNPEMRAHTLEVITDIATRYEVDGIHLDYIRYPGATYSHDAVSEALFAQEQAQDPLLTYEDWQRGNVTTIVSEAQQALRSLGKRQTLSAAVFGVYQDKWNWGGVSEGYSDYYQDAQAWGQQGILDVLIPMLYWPLTSPKGEPLDYYTLLSDWILSSGATPVYGGIKGTYPTFDEIAAEIAVSRELGAGGEVIFSYSGLESLQYFDDLVAGPYAEPAVVPAL